MPAISLKIDKRILPRIEIIDTLKPSFKPVINIPPINELLHYMYKYVISKFNFLKKLQLISFRFIIEIIGGKNE